MARPEKAKHLHLQIHMPDQQPVSLSGPTQSFACACEPQKKKKAETSGSQTKTKPKGVWTLRVAGPSAEGSVRLATRPGRLQRLCATHQT